MKIGRQIDRQRDRDGRAEVRDTIAPALHHSNVKIIIINKTINYSSIIQEIKKDLHATKLQYYLKIL